MRGSRTGLHGIGLVVVIAIAVAMVVPNAGAVTPAPGPSTGAAPVFAPTTPAVCTVPVGSDPQYDAYDPANHYVYVPNFASGNLSIISGCSVVGTVTFPSGAEPRAAAFDPANNQVYVTDSHRNVVYSIRGTSLSGTIKSKTFDGPYGIGFEPSEQFIEVANGNSNTVTFIYQGIIAGTNTVGSGPRFFAYDPFAGRILVTNYNSDNVTSLFAYNPLVQDANKNIPVGSKPLGIAFDVADSEDYVANGGSNNVSVITGVGSTGHSIKVGTAPSGAVWDQAYLGVYVTNAGSHSISVLEGTSVARTLTGISGATLLGIDYDDATDQVYTVGSTSDAVYTYDPVVSARPAGGAAPAPLTTAACTPSVGTGPEFDAYDPVSHDTYVPNTLSHSITILHGCTVSATVSLPSHAQPEEAAFDPATNQVWVTDIHLSTVYVLSGATIAANLTGKWIKYPEGVGFDPGTGNMIVSSTDHDTLALYSGTTYVDSTPVGIVPIMFTFDPYFDVFLVVNFGSDNVTAMSANDPTNLSSHASIPVGYEPIGIAFDPADDYDYVANWGGSNLSIVAGDGLQSGSLSVGSNPRTLVWDQTTLSIDVANDGSGNVSKVQGLAVVGTITGPSLAEFDGITFDDATEQIYVSAYGLNDVYVYNT
jgi:DNA-binding beta-propeller fold protein YncE